MARLIETATAPLRSVDVDLVTLDLVENGLRNARYEMDEVLFRTALSPGIREQHDEFPLIGDPEGKMVVGQFGLSIPDFLENFEGDIEEGDVLLTSDPYSCGAAISHANDWLVVMPIYHEGRIVGWSSMFGHMSDVGGKTPASMPTDAKTIFEEGVIIPPFKLYKKGVLDDDALRIILNQVRKPDWNRADLNGIVAACRTASRRVQEMCARFGDGHLHLGARRPARPQLPGDEDAAGDGVRGGQDALVHRLHLRRRRRLRPLRAQAQPHPHRRQGAAGLHRQQPAGAGAGQLLHQREPGPDVLRDLHDHCRRPADPVERRVLPAGGRGDPRGVVLEAEVPSRAQRPQPRHRQGLRPVRRLARPDEPGPAQCCRASRPRLTSCTRATTAPGTARGSGSSCTRSVSAASPAGRSATAPTGTRCGRRSSTSRASTSSRTTRCASSAGRRWRTRAAPVCTGAATAWTSPTASSSRARSRSTTTAGSPTRGGSTAASRAPGARNGSSVRTAPPRCCPARSTTSRSTSGDLLHFVTWGGGGWGDPLARDPELVGLEVRRGLVSVEGARRYGVVCDEQGQVDGDATEQLREKLKDGRPDPLPTFNMGPPLEEILARCEEETGLPAPKPPIAR